MLFEMIVPPFIRTLGNLSRILDKGAQHADTKKFELEILLNARLAPDQFNLIRQVQIACDTAKYAGARLAGTEAPAYEDTEKSLPELKVRIDKTVQYLRTISAADFKGAEERKITTPRWEGKYLLGADYAVGHAVPNFYFHVTTAYAILRHNGVDVGKKDFLGELPYKK